MKTAQIIKILKKGRSQMEVADLLGISQALVSRIVNGSRPMPEPVRRLAIRIIAEERLRRRAADALRNNVTGRSS